MAFGVSEAQLADMSLSFGLDLDSNVAECNALTLGTALTKTLEELILAPRRTNVNENGFSMSWDYASVSNYYLWLCKKYGIKPDSDVVAMLGISSIIDKTNVW